MTVLHKRLIGGAAQLVTTGSAGGGTGGQNGGDTTYPVNVLLHSFGLTNWGPSSSVGMASRGTVFKRDDVPFGYQPDIQINGVSVPHQWDLVTTHKNGSWKRAVFTVLLPDFAANSAPVTIDFVRVAGAYTASSPLTLAQVLAGTDFKAHFANFQQASPSDITSFSTRGSGSFTAHLTAHAAVSTRVTRLASGQRRNSWRIWGMATDDTGGAEDPHLKVYWYVDSWHRADGSIYALEVAPVISMDWWSTPNKYLLKYDAAFLNGATTLNSYAGVVHPYNEMWIMCYTGADYNVGNAIWIGNPMPTLNYTFDKHYWWASGAIPPIDPNLAMWQFSTGMPTYVPLSSQDHRAAIDGQGQYQGRGLIPTMDVCAFSRQGAYDWARMRVNGHAGLHVPKHFKSNKTRTRPGETTADISSTVCTLLMDPLTGDANDFTADGMPPSAEAIIDPKYSNDGLVWQQSGTGVWSSSYPDSSHAVAYSFMSWMVEGRAWHMDATLSMGVFAVQQATAGYCSTTGPVMNNPANRVLAALWPNLPSTPVWKGINWSGYTGNCRALGWMHMLIGQAAGTVPDSYVEGRYMRTLSDHNAAFWAYSYQFQPPNMNAAGWLASNSQSGWGGLDIWMNNFITMGARHAAILTENNDYATIAAIGARLPIGMVACGRLYMLDSYESATTPKEAAWDPATNDYYPINKIGSSDTMAYIQSSVLQLFEFWDSSNNTLPLQNGDVIVFTHDSYFYQSSVIPPEVVEGQDYYAVNVGAPTNSQSEASFQVAATPGGTPITFAQDYTGGHQIQLNVRYQADSQYAVAQKPPYIPPGDSYSRIAKAVIEQEAWAGSADAKAVLPTIRTFLAPRYTPTDIWGPWELSAG